MSNSQADQEALLRILSSVMEAAVENQNLAKDILDQAADAIGRLHDASVRMPSTVAGKVDVKLKEATSTAADTLVARFTEANTNAELATAAYINASRHALTKIVLMALAITAICAIGIVLMVRYAAPSYSEIQQLRQERDTLIGQIRWLDQINKIDLIPCSYGNTSRICAKVEDRSGRVGSYQLLANKRR